MMFANQSTSPNMFAICSCRAHLNLENIFRRCQISHWTKLEAPYKGCTVICTFFIKCSSLKIMKFFIEFFFSLNFLPNEPYHLISNPNPRIWRPEPFSRPFFGPTSGLELARKTDRKFHDYFFVCYIRRKSFHAKFSFGRKKWKFSWTWVILSRLRK